MGECNPSSTYISIRYWGVGVAIKLFKKKYHIYIYIYINLLETRMELYVISSMEHHNGCQWMSRHVRYSHRGTVWSEMILNHWLIVEKHPKSNGVVAGSTPLKNVTPSKTWGDWIHRAYDIKEYLSVSITKPNEDRDFQYILCIWVCYSNVMINCWTHITLDIGSLNNNTLVQGQLHTWAKGRDHVIERGPRLLSKGRTKCLIDMVCHVRIHVEFSSMINSLGP